MKLKKKSGQDKSVGAVESENPSVTVENDSQDISISLLATGSTEVLPDEALNVTPEVAEDSTSPVRSITHRP